MWINAAELGRGNLVDRLSLWCFRIRVLLGIGPLKCICTLFLVVPVPAGEDQRSDGGRPDSDINNIHLKLPTKYLDGWLCGIYLYAHMCLQVGYVVTISFKLFTAVKVHAKTALLVEHVPLE